jgi:hypothetical protein
MAERTTEKMTEWVDIKMDALSSDERIRLIEEICATLTPQELQTVRDLAEKQRQSKARQNILYTSAEISRLYSAPEFPRK